MSIKFTPSLKPIAEVGETPVTTSKDVPMSAQRRVELDKEVAAMFREHKQFWKDNQDNQKKMSELGKK